MSRQSFGRICWRVDDSRPWSIYCYTFELGDFEAMRLQINLITRGTSYECRPFLSFRYIVTDYVGDLYLPRQFPPDEDGRLMEVPSEILEAALSA